MNNNANVEEQLLQLNNKVKKLNEQLQIKGEEEYRSTGRLVSVELNECAVEVENCYLRIQQLEELKKRTDADKA